MKKGVILCILIVTAAFASVQAQIRDCRQIVLPHTGYNQTILNNMPEEKIQWYCRYSANSFFVTDTVPVGATIYNISDLVSVQTGNNLDQSFVVDLETLSYYAYNFWDFQVPNGDLTIYFRTPSSERAYLGVYSVQQTFIRTDGGTGAY